VKNRIAHWCFVMSCYLAAFGYMYVYHPYHDCLDWLRKLRK